MAKYIIILTPIKKFQKNKSKSKDFQQVQTIYYIYDLQQQILR